MVVIPALSRVHPSLGAEPYRCRIKTDATELAVMPGLEVPSQLASHAWNNDHTPVLKRYTVELVHVEVRV